MTTFERGETSNARAGSERAAESDVRKPEMAARPSPVRGEGERQASRARG